MYKVYLSIMQAGMLYLESHLAHNRIHIAMEPSKKSSCCQERHQV